MRVRRRLVLIKAMLALFILSGPAPPASAFEKWWGGGLEFKLGWPPIAFRKEVQGEDPAKVAELVRASLTAETWERVARNVRWIATGDTREEVEGILGVERHEVESGEGVTETIGIADGYIGAISTPRRMEFGYLDGHLAVRKWIVFFDETDRVVETEVFPEGRNEDLLTERKLPEGLSGTPPVSHYALDYQLGEVRGFPFLSRTGWLLAKSGLRRIKPGDSRLSVEQAVDGRYYLFGHRAWFIALGLLPGSSSLESDGVETLAFGWTDGTAPVVKARVLLKDNLVREIRFMDESP